MVKDMFGYEHPPSSCCGAPILSSSGPGYEHLICDNCNRIIKDLTKPKATIRFASNIAPGVDIISPPIEVTNVELILGDENEEDDVSRRVSATHSDHD